MNRLTLHKALGEGRGNETTKDTHTKPKHTHDVIRDVERKKERKTPEAMEKHVHVILDHYWI